MQIEYHWPFDMHQCICLSMADQNSEVINLCCTQICSALIYIYIDIHISYVCMHACMYVCMYIEVWFAYMGVPENGWFIRENPKQKWMI